MEDFISSAIFVKIIGFVAGVITSFAMLPQIIKTIKKKQAEDISVVMIVVLMTGIAGWIYYGILRKDMPLIFTNCFSLILNMILLFLHWKYKNNKESQ